MNLTLHIDGGSRGNPGPAGAGVVLRHAETEEPFYEAAFFLGHQTNNAAEYHGLIRGLQRAAAAEASDLSIFSDSELLVRQVTGEYAVKSPTLQTLYAQVQMLLLKLPRWRIQHVRREFNKRADELANLAMDNQQDEVVLDAGADGDAVQADPPPASPVKSPLPSDPPAAPTYVETTDGDRRVRVKRVDASSDCEAGVACASEYVVGPSIPADLCIYAAHAILPTVLAIHGTAAQEFAAVPTMTVRCSHPNCKATFQLTPDRGVNGNGSTS